MTIVKIPKRISEYPIYCLLLEIYIFFSPTRLLRLFPNNLSVISFFFHPLHAERNVCTLPNQAAIGHPSRTLKPPSTTLCCSVVFVEKKSNVTSAKHSANRKVFYFSPFSTTPKTFHILNE